MRIQDFTNMSEFEQIMADWAKATGLATVAVDANGKYISECYNFTDFCIKYTRGSAEGKRRCEKCDNECKGIYKCHAGLIDFSIDIVVKGEKLGAVIGGQVLPSNPDEETFRKVAREIGVNEDEYIYALQRVNVRDEEAINASANLLGAVLNNLVNASYERKYNDKLIASLSECITNCEQEVDAITGMTMKLSGIQKKQSILALNASIEAARSGDAGKGFAVVAHEVEALAKNSKELNGQIFDCVNKISDTLHQITTTNK